MSERLKGAFIGCPYHDDDYEACIQHSGQAPCDFPENMKAAWQADALEVQAEAYAVKQTLRVSMELQDAADELRRKAEEAAE